MEDHNLADRIVNFFVVNEGKREISEKKVNVASHRRTINLSPRDKTSLALKAQFQKQITFPDQRTKSWFLSNSPGPLLIVLVSYLYFCLYAGPRYMKNRKPFQLKNTLIVYNVIQVALSAVLVIEVNSCFLMTHIATIFFFQITIDVQDFVFSFAARRSQIYFYCTFILDANARVFMFPIIFLYRGWKADGGNIIIFDVNLLTTRQTQMRCG